MPRKNLDKRKKYLQKKKDRKRGAKKKIEKKETPFWVR